VNYTLAFALQLKKKHVQLRKYIIGAFVGFLCIYSINKMNGSRSKIVQSNFLKVFSTLSVCCVNVFNIKIFSRIFQALGTLKSQIRGKP
jgi:hypothetical protein